MVLCWSVCMLLHHCSLQYPTPPELPERADPSELRPSLRAPSIDMSEALPSLFTPELKSRMGDGDEGEDKRELEGFLRESARGL